MKELYLIRHTTPDIKPGICYGISDIDVKSDFKEESVHIKNAILDFTPQIVYSSPLIRCKKLAKKLFPHTYTSYSDNLKEMNFGQWEFLPWADIPQSEMETWSADFVNTSPPQGECLQQLYDRTIQFYNQTILSSDSEKIAIVTHSGVMRCILANLMQIPLKNIFKLKLNYGAIIKVVVHDSFEEIEFIIS